MLELTNQEYKNLLKEYGNMESLREYIKNSKDNSFFDNLYAETKAFFERYFNENSKKVYLYQRLDDKNYTPEDISVLKKLIFINANFEDSFNEHDALLHYTNNRKYNGPKEINAYKVIPFALSGLIIQAEMEDKDIAKVDDIISIIRKYEPVRIDKEDPVGISAHNISAAVYRRKLWNSAYETANDVQKQYKTGKLDIDQAIAQLEDAKNSISKLSVDPDVEYCYNQIDKLIKNYQSIKSNTPEL